MKACIYFLTCLFFCSILPPSTYAQEKEKILAQGNPPLTQSMADKTIGFFEWVLNLRLSPGQMSQVQASLVNSWKANEQEEMKGVLEIIGIYEEIMQMNVNERDRIKENLQKPVLQNIRSNPNDEISKILLAAYNGSLPGSQKRSADSARPAAPAMSKLRVGADGFTGLYRMMRPKAININSSIPETGYYIEHIIFFPGGKLYRSLPPEGLLYFDPVIAQQAHPNNWGTYEFKNGDILIALGPNKTPYTITRNGDRLNNPPALGKGSFRPMPNCDGLKLEGSYRRHESEPAIKFTKNGKFEDGGVFGYFGTMARLDGSVYTDDGKGGSGTYLIEQNTLELRYSDGRIKRILIQVFPENLTKKPAVPSILLREERLEIM